MDIGGHTVNHAILSGLGANQQWEEISGCGRRLTEELGEPMRFFSYPNGRPRDFNEDTRVCLQKAGVRYAFSYYGGVRSPDDWDDYDIRRIAVESYVSQEYFRCILTLPQAFGHASSRSASPITSSPG